MEENNNIDKLFKSAIENHRMDPPDNVWNSLDSRLDIRQKERKKGKGGKRYLLLLLLLLISLPAYYYFTGNIGANQKSTYVSTPIAPSNEPSSLKNEPANIQSANSYSIKQGNDEISSTQKVAENPVAENYGPGLSVKQGQQAIKSASVHHGTVNTNVNINISSNSSPVQNLKANAGTAPSEMRNAGENNLSNRTINQTESVSADANDQQNDVIGLNENNAITDMNPIENRDSILKPDVQSASSIVQSDSSATHQDSTSSLSLLQKIKSRLSLGLFYSPDLSKRYLKSDGSSSNTNSLQNQPGYYDNEKSEYSWSGGIKLRYDLSDKWSISSGSYYSRFSQSAALNSIIVQSDEEYIEEHHGHDPGHGHNQGGGNNGGGNGWNNNGNNGGNWGGGNGSGWGGNGGGNNSGGGSGNGGGNNGGGNGGNDDPPHYVVHTSCGTVDLGDLPGGSSSYQSGDTINVRTDVSERIEFISIPLTLRFQVMKSRFAYYAEAGFAINWIIKNSVEVTIDNTYTQKNQIDGVKNMNYSLLFNAGVQYRLNKWFAVFAEPNIRYSISPINEYNTVKMFPYSLGINTGITFHF